MPRFYWLAKVSLIRTLVIADYRRSFETMLSLTITAADQLRAGAVALLRFYWLAKVSLIGTLVIASYRRSFETTLSLTITDAAQLRVSSVALPCY